MKIFKKEKTDTHKIYTILGIKIKKRRNKNTLLKKIKQFSKNYYKLRFYKRHDNLKLHIGCGNDDSIKKVFFDFINIDYRQTDVTDINCNLTELDFKPDSVDAAFSNAFFEHLYRNDRAKHLQSLYKILKNDGFVLYIGLPYFKNIAKFYLEERKGLIGDKFDLYHVYRYTHGDPESFDYAYLLQLHKSLFDENECYNLLKQTGFNYFVMFEYCYASGDYIEDLPVNIGFYAKKENTSIETLKENAYQQLKLLDKVKIDINTLKWIDINKG